jgi:hypothetical protein
MEWFRVGFLSGGAIAEKQRGWKRLVWSGQSGAYSAYKYGRSSEQVIGAVLGCLAPVKVGPAGCRTTQSTWPSSSAPDPRPRLASDIQGFAGRRTRQGADGNPNTSAMTSSWRATSTVISGTGVGMKPGFAADSAAIERVHDLTLRMPRSAAGQLGMFGAHAESGRGGRQSYVMHQVQNAINLPCGKAR